MSTPAQLESFAQGDWNGAAAAVLRYVTMHEPNGVTSEEVEAGLGMDRLTAASSLSTLRSAGEVKDSGRTRTRLRRSQTVWVLGDERHIVEVNRRRKLQKFPTQWLWDELARREAEGTISD